MLGLEKKRGNINFHVASFQRMNTILISHFLRFGALKKINM